MGSEKGTTKSQGQKDRLDKFYTLPEVALSCINLVHPEQYDLVIEPAAGNGSFSSQLPNCVAMDIEPEASEILRQDWFEYNLKRTAGRRTIVISNPPFGTSGNLAMKFVNHAAEFADTVAFVLPLSFKKHSVQNRIDRHLHLREELLLPGTCFTLNGAPYAVPCVFQIWDWRPELRAAHPRKLTSEHFDFVAKDGSPDCRIQRVGGNAGVASTDLDKAAASNYFIRIKTPVSVARFVAYVNTLSFPGRDFGVGPRTISKDELVSVFERNLPKDFIR
jgi:hypothetical protein